MTPFRRLKKSDSALIYFILRFLNFLKACLTSFSSFCLKRPLLIKIQIRFFPIALLINAAATEESTPPDKPRITRSLPIWLLISLIVSEIIFFEFHVFLNLQIFIKKFFIIFPLSLV